ncbi:hypothetical protein BDY19DRAFT_995154 [Irpex rosettiformis]|uniref:Uncharacterized protein n=1 Tax=Irpex rosettiformis TaxID=378272 RepID=A0ACB8TZ18_9APHY|nr:hypothetical protein BDY19DRAFT_995154 [Irpex rosettiformis]
MLPNPHQWTPTPYRSTSGVGPHGASPYRDTSPGTRSPPSRLQELQPVSLVTITNSARPTPHSKAFITDLEPPSSDLVVSPPVLPQPLPSSTQSLKINKSRRTGSMRTALLTHLASVRHQQNKSTEDDEDVSPKSIYSQSSLAYSTRQSSRPGKNEPDHRQAEKLSESTESHLRDSVVFQLPPVASPQNSNTFEDVSLTPSVTPKPSVETYSPVTLHADINTESPTEEGDWRSLRFKLLNTIQEHTIVSENGTRMYESVSRFPSLKY